MYTLSITGYCQSIDLLLELYSVDECQESLQILCLRIFDMVAEAIDNEDIDTLHEIDMIIEVIFDRFSFLEDDQLMEDIIELWCDYDGCYYCMQWLHTK